MVTRRYVRLLKPSTSPSPSSVSAATWIGAGDNTTEPPPRALSPAASTTSADTTTRSRSIRSAGTGPSATRNRPSGPVTARWGSVHAVGSGQRPSATERVTTTGAEATGAPDEYFAVPSNTSSSPIPAQGADGRTSTEKRGNTNGRTSNATSSRSAPLCQATRHVPLGASASSGNDDAATPQSPAAPRSSSTVTPCGSTTVQRPGRPSSGDSSVRRSIALRNSTVWPGRYSGRSVITWTSAGEYSGSGASTVASPYGAASVARST